MYRKQFDTGNQSQCRGNIACLFSIVAKKFHISWLVVPGGTCSTFGGSKHNNISTRSTVHLTQDRVQRLLHIKATEKSDCWVGYLLVLSGIDIIRDYFLKHKQTFSSHPRYLGKSKSKSRYVYHTALLLWTLYRRT